MSIVDSINCQTVEFSAVIQIGDSEELSAYSAGIAIKKEEPIYYKEYPFDLPELPNYLVPTRHVVERTNRKPINVRNISVTGITGSAIMHVGSFNRGEALSQIKNVRILTEK